MIFPRINEVFPLNKVALIELSLANFPQLLTRVTMAPPFFISKLNFSYDEYYSVDKVWTKIKCQFYFRGITLRIDIAH